MKHLISWEFCYQDMDVQGQCQGYVFEGRDLICGHGQDLFEAETTV